jgi:hypothetical protein
MLSFPAVEFVLKTWHSVFKLEEYNLNFSAENTVSLGMNMKYYREIISCLVRKAMKSYR